MTQPSPSPNQPAIVVENLECGYDDRVLLQHVSFAVKPGEIFFVIGGSGCGKSTLLKHMIGLHRPTAGTIRYFGESFTDAALGRRREMLRTFGVLYQNSALWSSLTLRENITLPLEEYTPLTKHERNELAALRLAQVNLSGYEDYYPSEISGGMKKRAALARALALDPAIVFFDEPSAGLDPVTSRKLDDLVLEIRETLGTTMVIVSHELDSIFSIADRVIMLEREAKGIIAEGNPRELLQSNQDPRVQEFLQRRAVLPATEA
ncbi:MAG: ATP-binding cassette domain-containing protein [Verrucomicrobia bacterium]|nr:ATP-binding cassette domain-containing protein [Verrucomicrobiota bacterium]